MVIKGASKYINIKMLKEIQENNYKTNKNEYYKEEVDAELWHKLGELTDRRNDILIKEADNYEHNKDTRSDIELLKMII